MLQELGVDYFFQKIHSEFPASLTGGVVHWHGESAAPLRDGGTSDHIVLT